VGSAQIRPCLGGHSVDGKCDHRKRKQEHQQGRRVQGSPNAVRDWREGQRGHRLCLENDFDPAAGIEVTGKSIR
jgi:hypothetical protein